jgi:ketosteroid isomerase-like protein
VTELIERLAEAMNQHDLDGAVGLVHEDYRSEQPAHPGRAFVGRAQMRANWEAMFAGIPDLRVEILGSVQGGVTAWTEWRWTGTRTDGVAVDVRGVTLFEIRDGEIVAGRLYMEDVELEATGIDEAVQTRSGRRPELR